MHTDFLVNRKRDIFRASPTPISILLCLGISIMGISSSSPLKQLTFLTFLRKLEKFVLNRKLGSRKNKERFLARSSCFLFLWSQNSASQSSIIGLTYSFVVSANAIRAKSSEVITFGLWPCYKYVTLTYTGGTVVAYYRRYPT